VTTGLTTPGRWSDPAWLDLALAWADDALDGVGVRRTAWTAPHSRAWSAVLRIETTGDPFWLKANGDGTRREAALLATLADLDIAATPRPVAADATLGLTLLPDGGPSVREVHGGSTPLAVVEDLLVRYAALQRATAPHVEDLLALGLDDARPARMTGLFAEIVEECARAEGAHVLTADDAARLRSVLPAYAEACAELDASGIAATLQHDDLHDNNVLARGPVFIDWGDALVGHPFGTMLVTLGSAAHQHGLDPGDPAVQRLADAYTEAWTDLADRTTLRRIVATAVRVGPLTRALGWRRALLGCDDASWAEWGDGVHGWLLDVLSPDLPLRPALLVGPA
jgi:hypothetical protein